jgi:hypothetical protein
MVSSAHFTMNLKSPKSLDATHSTQLNGSETCTFSAAMHGKDEASRLA